MSENFVLWIKRHDYTILLRVIKIDTGKIEYQEELK